ncbi:MAG TPA: addiction module protein [Fodinibius sp.]|nr:addiction module protein [Fodinibius sp.]
MQAWKTEVQRRKKQVQTGEVALIPGDQFDKEVQEMKKQFSE